MRDRPTKVFIFHSYPSFARDLATRLRADGIEALIEEWVVRPGDVIEDSIRLALRDCDHVVVLLTTTYLERLSGLLNDVPLPDGELLSEVLRDRPAMRVVPMYLETLPWEAAPEWLTTRAGVNAGKARWYERLLVALGERWDIAPPVAHRDAGPASPRRNVDGESTVRLERLHLRRFRGFEELTVELAEPEGDAVEEGQWTVLLGDNGVGKTSILWSIALAASGDLGAAIPSQLSARLVRRAEPSEASGERRASVDVMVSGATLGCELATANGRDVVRGLQGVPPFPLYAYGSTRGSALGGPDRAVQLDRPLDAVGTLFSLGTSLIHGETWLRNLEHRALKSSEEADLKAFEAVRSTLLGLLPGIDGLEILPDEVVVHGPSVGTCTLASLSDGYLTTLGWTVDLIARWAHEAQYFGKALEPGFNTQMTGLVLLDELDLHLHPRWQLRIIDDLRRAFPRMSFVATTHNPLTLLGARNGEIHVLERADTGAVEARQVDLPPGIRADQVLTGPWFGLASTLDTETRNLMERHRGMLRGGVARDDPERLDLEKRLRTRLGSYADTSEERLAQEIVARLTDEEAEDYVPRSRDQLRDAALAALTAQS